jgi:3-hydroxybutyrate dehydrogenase
MPDAPVAIITGCNGPVGIAIAESLAADGMVVLLNGTTGRQPLEEALARLEDEFGVRVGYYEADLSIPDEVRDMVRAATRDFGRVDVLVNNAAIVATAPLDPLAAAQWDAVLALNLSAAFHSISAALPQMIQRNWGRIVNVSCVHVLVAKRDKAAYIAASHGVVGLTRAVAAETAQTGVTCNAICPSLDVAAPRQIGALASFLCSEDAAQIRGVALPIDGGLVAQ